MARPKNSTIAVKKALEVPVEMLVSEASELVGCSSDELRSRFQSMGIDSSGWETIPLEMEPKLMEIKRIVEAEKSITSVAEELLTDNPSPVLEPKPTPESPKTDDIPLIEETPTPAVKPKRKRSTALTKKKSEALAQSQQEQQKLAYSEAQIFQLQHARKGQKDGAQLAVIEHEARQATYSQVKAHLLTREIAQLSAEIAAEQDFNPTEILAELGIEPASDIYEDLRSQIEPMLGKLTQSVEEIVETSLLNGVELDTEFTRLEKLLSSNNS